MRGGEGVSPFSVADLSVIFTTSVLTSELMARLIAGLVAAGTG
jgi:hypothetical protein